MGDASLVDWGLARRTARVVASRGPHDVGSWVPGQAEVSAACEEALGAASAYTGLAAQERPAPELVGREQWAHGALGTLGEASAQIEAKLDAELSMPGPLADLMRRLAGTAAGVEAGVAVGYAARRVLGQYDVSLIGARRAPRLLLVGPNIATARVELAAAPATFLRWIALHETTHVLQFEGVPWLEGHLRDLIGELIAGAGGALEPRELARRMLRGDPRRLLRSILRGELVEALLGDGRRKVFDRLQGAMAALEGHAEHVMDVCAATVDPDIRDLRRRLELRRSSRAGLGDVVARLLGLESKLRQYRLGKTFCDAIVDRGGVEAQVALWKAPANLPSLEELEAPDRWLDRVGIVTPTAA